MQDRRQKASQAFRQAIEHITAGTASLPQVLRMGLDACLLADLRDEAVWFRRELDGYAHGDELPPYRRGIPGAVYVEPQDPLAAVPGSAVKYLYDLMHVTNPAQDEPPRPTTRDIHESIEWISEVACTGWAEQVGEWIPREAMTLTAYSRHVARYAPAAFRPILVRVRGLAQETARRLEIDLTYGDAVQDIWERYRADVEPELARMGLEDHFRMIRDGIRSDNREGWRAAMWECRSVLEALAATLWQDSSPTYPATPTGSTKAMSVTKGDTLNRLTAYLHCKGVEGTTPTYLESELGRIVASLHGLYGLDSKAHSGAPVSEEDAKLAVVSTYTMLSQFVLRTDLQPVLDQRDCMAAGSGKAITASNEHA